MCIKFLLLPVGLFSPFLCYEVFLCCSCLFAHLCACPLLSLLPRVSILIPTNQTFIQSASHSMPIEGADNESWPDRHFVECEKRRRTTGGCLRRVSSPSVSSEMPPGFRGTAGIRSSAELQPRRFPTCISCHLCVVCVYRCICLSARVLEQITRPGDLYFLFFFIGTLEAPFSLCVCFTR